MIKEFKEFIAQGNVIDLAVGVIIGGAFNAIVTSLVDDIIMPLIGVIIGGLDFTGLAITVGSAQITYGAFIQAVVNFFIIALSVFVLVKAVNGMQALRKKEEEEEAAEEMAEEVKEEVALLTEIRDLLKK